MPKSSDALVDRSAKPATRTKKPAAIAPIEHGTAAAAKSEPVHTSPVSEPARSRRVYGFGGAGAITVSLEDLNLLALPTQTRTRLFETLDQLAELEGQSRK
ncbi:hypothetical protein [Nocardia brasiliensis]|uniref:hypothetical protein n=1 Tax=Nocardia brasiliensis TaxID=37326 RepID=UPI003D8E4966